MFSDLKSIVDLIRSGISDMRKSQSEKEREEAALALLRVYFLLKDCVEDGARLISEAGANPTKTVEAMDEWTAATTLERWDRVLLRQSRRLSAVHGSILGQDHLTVIDPALQEKIKGVIGSKMKRANSLHGIGAALFFRFIFPVAITNEERARYVTVIAGAEGDLLNMERVEQEINELREALEGYRAVVGQMLSKDEILKLSRQARQETLPPPES